LNSFEFSNKPAKEQNAISQVNEETHHPGFGLGLDALVRLEVGG